MNLLLIISRFIPDKLYLKVMFYRHFHKILNFKKPKTLNEKIQWLKINDRNPEYTRLVDKYEVRNYIADVLGERYLIPLLGVWDSVDEINYDALPNQFVLKCNHDSKGVVICKDKKNFNFKATKNMLNNHLKKNGYWYGREWPYKNVKPCIIAEKYMVDESTIELKDYKIMCFNGVPDNIMVCYSRKNGHADYDFFDLSWNWLPYNKGDEHLDRNFTIPKPKSLNKMIEIAQKLSKDYYFARIDLYDIEGQAYFGEITFYPASGLDKDITETTDYLLGSKLSLRIS